LFGGSRIDLFGAVSTTVTPEKKEDSARSALVTGGGIWRHWFWASFSAPFLWNHLQRPRIWLPLQVFYHGVGF